MLDFKNFQSFHKMSLASQYLLAKRKMHSMHLQAKSDQSENSIDASNTSEKMFFEACASTSNNTSYREGEDTASHFPASYSSPPKTNATGASNPQMQTPSPVMIGGRGGGGGRPKR